MLYKLGAQAYDNAWPLGSGQMLHYQAVARMPLCV